MITSEAEKTATVKSEQVALPTSDEDTLSKRQVVSTAGNATRDIITYTVLGGDTLSGIAAKFGVTTNTLKWANDLSDADMVSPGDKLIILPITGLLYTVQSGDTAEALADKYHANAAQIISYNDAEASGLQPGAKIIIPDGYKDEPRPVTTTSSIAYDNAATSSYTPQLTSYSGGGGGYAFGYCTYYVSLRRSIPGDWGNANAWYWNAQQDGFSVGSVPVPGAIAWTGAGYYGHVAYVESVSGGMVTISEMNFNGGWNRVSWRTVPASTFLYIY